MIEEAIQEAVVDPQDQACDPVGADPGQPAAQGQTEDPADVDEPTDQAEQVQGFDPAAPGAERSAEAGQFPPAPPEWMDRDSYWDESDRMWVQPALRVEVKIGVVETEDGSKAITLVGGDTTYGYFDAFSSDYEMSQGTGLQGTLIMVANGLSEAVKSTLRQYLKDARRIGLLPDHKPGLGDVIAQVMGVR